MTKKLLARLLPAVLLPFAFCACSKTPYAELPKVSESEIWNYAEQSVAFGNRCAGSPEIRKYAQWISETAAKSNKFKVYSQKFSAPTPRGEVLFENIIAEISGKDADFILVAAHYDIKRFQLLRNFQGANDGASGVAALLGMISALQKHDRLPPCGIRFVFFDGEECMVQYGPADGLHGSRALAREWEKNGTLKQCRAMILLDMIGDRELTLTIPENCTKSLVQMAIRLAGETGFGGKCTEFNAEILDDHVPFLEKGIPSINLIDFDYGPGNAFWHTEQDSLDKISASSIRTVADFTIGLCWKIAEN